jgi:hypothetical protein
MKKMNHIEYPKSLKKLSTESLNYRLADAQDALNVWPDSPNASYYQDEVLYTAMELNNRKRG